MTLLEAVVAAVEADASQEDIQALEYARNRINSMPQYEFLEALSEALQRAQEEN